MPRNCRSQTWHFQGGFLAACRSSMWRSKRGQGRIQCDVLRPYLPKSVRFRRESDYSGRLLGEPSKLVAATPEGRDP